MGSNDASDDERPGMEALQELADRLDALTSRVIEVAAAPPGLPALESLKAHKARLLTEPGGLGETKCELVAWSCPKNPEPPTPELPESPLAEDILLWCWNMRLYVYEALGPRPGQRFIEALDRLIEILAGLGDAQPENLLEMDLPGLGQGSEGLSR